MDEEQGKNSFIIYCDQLDALDHLTDEQMGKLIRCLCKHVRGTLETKYIRKDILSAIKLLITQINIDKNKYGKRVEKAKKAISTRWENAKKDTSAYVSILPNTKEHQVFDRIPNVNGNVNDNGNDNGNVNVNVDVNDNVNVAAAAAAAEKKADGKPSAPAAAAKKNKKEILTEGQIITVIKEFNKFMDDRTIPCVHKMTDERRELVQEIWQEYSWADMQKVFYNAAYSPFLNGQTKKKFLATFEWIMNKTNFLRILEGTFSV